VPNSQTLLARLRGLASLSIADPAFDPAALAAGARLSERTLYRRLKELTGLTPAAWLREQRLEYARRLLESGARPTVAQVAYAAGFVNADYFGQLYFQRFGCRPSDHLRGEC